MKLIVNGRLQITQIEHLDYKLLIKAEQREQLRCEFILSFF